MNKLAFSSLFMFATGFTAFASTPENITTEMNPDSPYQILNDNKDNSILSKILKSNKNSEVFNLKLHTKISFSGAEVNNNWNEPGFKVNQLRIDLGGRFNNGIFYRYQQRLTNYPEPYDNYIDNLPMKVDYAGLGYRFNTKWKVFAGKMCTAYGGFDFDDNPINVYQYSTMIENMAAFLTGIDFAYNPSASQEIRFQILESRNGSHEQAYGFVNPDLKFNKADFVYTLNWNGSFGPENMFATRWSASYINQAKDKNYYLLALGNAMYLKNGGGFLDFMYSNEGIDRSGIISSIGSSQDGINTQTNTSYTSTVLGLNYRIHPKWNLIAKGIYDTSYKNKNVGGMAKGKYLTTYSYSGGIEFFPFKDESLHLGLVYTGRYNDYTSLAKEFGAKNSKENKIELSLIYSLNIW